MPATCICFNSATSGVSFISKPGRDSLSRSPITQLSDKIGNLTKRLIGLAIGPFLVNEHTPFSILPPTIMNIPAIFKTLRKKDWQIADDMGVKIAQLSRRQKKDQNPSKENQEKIKAYVLDHIATLQKLIEK